MDPTILAHPSLPPKPAPTTPARRSKWFYIAIAGIILGFLCCLVGLIAILVAMNLNKKSAPAAMHVPVVATSQVSLGRPFKSSPINERTWPASGNSGDEGGSHRYQDIEPLHRAASNSREFRPGGPGLAGWSGAAPNSGGF
jgi:hypothetical protein